MKHAKLIKVSATATPGETREAEIEAVMNALYRCDRDSGKHWQGSWQVSRTNEGWLVSHNDDQVGTSYRSDTARHRFFVCSAYEGGSGLYIGTRIESFRENAEREVEQLELNEEN